MQLPNKFIDRIKVQFGNESEVFLNSMSEKPSLSIRYNPNKFKNENLENKVPWTKYGYYLSERPIFTLDPMFHLGAYYVQDASSMFVEEALRQTVNLENDLKVLDLCAAPGGKTTSIASLISENSLLIANEVNRKRAEILKENVIKWGQSNIWVTSNESKSFNRIKSYFDVILIDAPCSGEGMFRKDETAIEEWSENSVTFCANRQKEIIEDVWDSLKTDGILIYSTCTFASKENEENINWILENKDCKSLKLDISQFDGITEIQQNNMFAYYFYPNKVKGEGLFISVIQKEQSEYSPSKQNNIKKLYKPFVAVNNNVKSFVANSINLKENDTLLDKDNTIILINNKHLFDLSFLNNHLYFRSIGVECFEVFGNKIKQLHSLSNYSNINLSKTNIIELELNDALKYLKKEDLKIEFSDYKQGMNLVTYLGLGLGWLNIIGNRANNLYPKDWKIKMNLNNL